MAATIEVKGLNEVLRRLKKYGDGVEKEVKNELYASALDIQRDAVNNLNSQDAVDTGALKQSSFIRPIEGNLSAFEVGFTKEYAPYIEFGTGTLAEVEPELQEYANQFRGKGERQVNLPARPYLFPAFASNGDKLVQRLKRFLKAKKL